MKSNDEDYTEIAREAFIRYLMQLTQQRKADLMIRETCRQIHVFYTGFVDAGFTESQALALVIAAMRGGQ